MVTISLLSSSFFLTERLLNKYANNMMLRHYWHWFYWFAGSAVPTTLSPPVESSRSSVTLHRSRFSPKPVRNRTYRSPIALYNFLILSLSINPFWYLSVLWSEWTKVLCYCIDLDFHSYQFCKHSGPVSFHEN